MVVVVVIVHSHAESQLLAVGHAGDFARLFASFLTRRAAAWLPGMAMMAMTTNSSIKVK
jgi:hypothetical protein